MVKRSRLPKKMFSPTPAQRQAGRGRGSARNRGQGRPKPLRISPEPTGAGEPPATPVTSDDGSEPDSSPEPQLSPAEEAPEQRGGRGRGGARGRGQGRAELLRQPAGGGRAPTAPDSSDDDIEEPQQAPADEALAPIAPATSPDQSPAAEAAAQPDNPSTAVRGPAAAPAVPARRAAKRPNPVLADAARDSIRASLDRFCSAAAPREAVTVAPASGAGAPTRGGPTAPPPSTPAATAPSARARLAAQFDASAGTLVSGTTIYIAVTKMRRDRSNVPQSLTAAPYTHVPKCHAPTTIIGMLPLVRTLPPPRALPPRLCALPHLRAPRLCALTTPALIRTPQPQCLTSYAPRYP